VSFPLISLLNIFRQSFIIFFLFFFARISSGNVFSEIFLLLVTMQGPNYSRYVNCNEAVCECVFQCDEPSHKHDIAAPFYIFCIICKEINIVTFRSCLDVHTEGGI